MGKYLNISLSIVFNFGLLLPLSAQRQMGVLTRGNIVVKEIAAGEKHIYRVNLEKNSFAQLNVLQKGAVG